jgi:hypothetical protein
MLEPVAIYHQRAIFEEAYKLITGQTYPFHNDTTHRMADENEGSFGGIFQLRSSAKSPLVVLKRRRKSKMIKD